MDSKCQIIFILNPLSGDGITGEMWPEIEAVLRRLGISYRLVKSEGDLSVRTLEVLREGVDTGACIAGVGGDGTHCAIINGMMRHMEDAGAPPLPPYAIIPLGTANNVAKSFGIYGGGKMFGNSLARALKGAVFGADFHIDIAKIGDRYFVDDFSAGFDAVVLGGRDADKRALSKKPLLSHIFRGYSIYFFNVVKSLFTQSPSEIVVESSGRRVFEGEAFNVVVNNTRIYAGEFDFTDSAIANDGLLDMLIFTGRRDYFRRFILGSRRMPHGIRRFAHKNDGLVQHMKGTSFKISSPHPIEYQTDGEFMGSSDSIEISVKPRAIKIKIPVEPE